MIRNLVDPWILARLVMGVAVSLLLLHAVRVAVRVLKHWRVGETNEGQLALERRAELVATIVQAALVVAVGSLALTVLVADRLTGSIRGAMCAWGVFASTQWGFAAVATSALAAAACALWVVLHRLDMRLHAPRLTRAKFLALLVVAPIVWVDLITTIRFASALDLDVVASCCSTTLDSGVAAFGASDFGRSRTTLALLAAAAAVAAIATAAWARRSPGAASAWSAALSSLVAFALSLPAILYYVAPHVYETPHHLCPFCLLRGDVGGIGWPLFGAIFLGTVLGVGLGVVEASRRASGEPEQASALERSLARWVAVAWITALVVAVYPVARFAIVSHGASLFGAA